MKFSKLTLVSILIAIAMPVLGQKAVKYKTEDGKEVTGWLSYTASDWSNLGPSGTWWRNQNYITLLTLTPDQQKRMDDVFQQSRLKLIDLKANLDKEEATLEPLMKADRLDETRIAPQIDKVADARAELEKGRARMLLGIRQVLTPEQWTKLSNSKGYYAGALEAYKLTIPKK